MTKRLTPEVKAARLAERRHRRLTPLISASVASKIALGDRIEPKARQAQRLAIAIGKARRGAEAPQPLPPPEPMGEPWPERGQCCWPTSAGRPWRFCRATVDPASKSGYCAEHHSAERGKARPADVPPQPFVLPHSLAHQDNAVRASRSAAAQIAMRQPRK